MVTVISSRVFPRPRHNTHEATDFGEGTEPADKDQNGKLLSKICYFSMQLTINMIHQYVFLLTQVVFKRKTYLKTLKIVCVWVANPYSRCLWRWRSCLAHLGWNVCSSSAAAAGKMPPASETHTQQWVEVRIKKAPPVSLYLSLHETLNNLND